MYLQQVYYSVLTISRKANTSDSRTFFYFFLQRFRGNYDIYHTVAQRVSPYIRTRYLRIHPKQWRSYIAMRVELYGCRYNGKLTIYTCTIEPLLMATSPQQPPFYSCHIFLPQLGDLLLYKPPSSGQ